jgi:hypothetical protein
MFKNLTEESYSFISTRSLAMRSHDRRSERTLFDALAALRSWAGRAWWGSRAVLVKFR